MPSTSSAEDVAGKPRLLESIRGRIALANLANVLVLLVVAAVATVQFRELVKLFGTVSDRAEVLMRLSHASDEREDLLASFRKGYASGDPAANSARTRFDAIANDLRGHAKAASAKVGAGAAAEFLSKMDAELAKDVARVAELGALGADEREVATIELEEGLGDVVALIGQARLEARRDLERQLASVKVELGKPERLFWLAAACGGLMALGISFFLRSRVSVPILRLSQAVGALARGNPTPVSAIGRDELGRLGSAFNSMAETITERNRSLKLVLDSVGDGLITCDLDGNVIGEPSRSAVTWFGSVTPETKVWDYLLAHDLRLREWFVLGFEQITSEILPFEAAAEQIPQEICFADRTFALAVRPVRVDEQLSRVLLVVTDITEKRALAQKESESRDVYHLASVALREPETFTDFVSDTNKRLARIAERKDLLLELHTIKGNASVMGCDAFSSRVHAAESRAVEDLLSANDIAELSARWQTLVRTSEATVGRSVNSALVIPRIEYERLCALLAQGRHAEAQTLAKAWSMHRMAAIFERLSRTAELFAARTGKEVRTDSEGGELMVPRGPLDELWSCLVHLVKNTVAHGVERSDGRIAQGKPAQGKVSLLASSQGDQFSVRVRDDGAGIDWEALGVAEPDLERRLEALTRNGSSAQEVSEVAGRGVGLAAVRKVVEGLGGHMVVHSEKGRGTDVIATVPISGVVRINNDLLG